MSGSLRLVKPARQLFTLKGLTWCLIGTIVVSVAAALAGLFYAGDKHDRFFQARQETKHVRVLQQALSDSHIAVVALASGAERTDLKAYYDGLKTISDVKPWIAKIDSYYSQTDRAGLASVGAQIQQLSDIWADILHQVQTGRADEARAVIKRDDFGALYGRTRDALQMYWRERMEVAVASQSGADNVQLIAVLLQVFAGVWSITGLLLVYRMSQAESRARADAKSAADASRLQMAQLFQMADMLQSASGHLDANAVLRATSERLLPGLAGSLYVFNNSRDRLDRSTSFGPAEQTADVPETIAPTQCWALKRGKPHINKNSPAALCCDHHGIEQHDVVMEIPMTARGELLGLLQISAVGDDAEAALVRHQELAIAIADGMSLALSNIALREKLRGQALRDPLTGLYNRRYMEDSLERLVRLAGREKKNLSLIMIDLDHFKKLNDTHGHAMGDAVLREAAAAILGALRESDVACRYGGEELLVILPDCSIEDAALKAEDIRGRIQDLSSNHGTSVTASFGVSSMPLVASQMPDLIATADAALYAAKKQGRNCVVMAEPLRAKVALSQAAQTPPAVAAVASLVAAE